MKPSSGSGASPRRAPGRPDPGELEQRLGYRFHTPALMQQALTHRSLSQQRNYERLEFLGDALLGFVIARTLFDRHAEASESDLTLLRATLVRQRTLAEVARELGLGDFLHLGEGALRSGTFRRDSVLADAVEALIGAVLLDGGEAAATALVLRLLAAPLQRAHPDHVQKDAKTQLQEWLQGVGEPLPEYEIVTITGQAPQQRFRVCCRVVGRGLTAEADGTSRRRAEQEAARLVLDRLVASS